MKIKCPLTSEDIIRNFIEYQNSNHDLRFNEINHMILDAMSEIRRAKMIEHRFDETGNVYQYDNDLHAFIWIGQRFHDETEEEVIERLLDNQEYNEGLNNEN